MGKKKKAKPVKRGPLAKIQYYARLRKLAKLMRKRERLLDRLYSVVLDESILESRTAREIEEFLDAQKRK